MSCPKCGPATGRRWTLWLGLVFVIVTGIALWEWKGGTRQPSSIAPGSSSDPTTPVGGVSTALEEELSRAYPVTGALRDRHPQVRAAGCACSGAAI